MRMSFLVGIVVDDVEDGLQVLPVGHIVDVVDAVVVEDGVQVKPVGHMVVVV